METNSIEPEDIAAMYEVEGFGECSCGREDRLYRRGKFLYCMWCLVESIKKDYKEFEQRAEREEEIRKRSKQFTLLEAM